MEPIVQITTALGYAYARAGRIEEARKSLQELQNRTGREHVSDYALTIIYTGLGDKDAAMAALQEAFDSRDEYMPYLTVDPFFDSLRTDPRFSEILRRLNIAANPARSDLD